MDLIKSVVSVCSSILLVAGLVPQVFAQSGSYFPRTTSGKPGFKGVWEFPYVPDMAGMGNGRNQTGPGEVPFIIAAKLNFDRYDSSKDDYTGTCLPFWHVRS